MAQIAQIQKLGLLTKTIGLIQLHQMKINAREVEGQVAHMRGIYDSMNRKERNDPILLDDKRRNRIARGAGVEPNEVANFIKQFEAAREMMKSIGGTGGGREFPN